MFMVDLGLALLVSVAISWLLLRWTRQHGSWENRWALVSILFACCWAGGAWLAPKHTNAWITYWIPFALVGIVVALIIAVVSPTHELNSKQDRREFEREENAVLWSVTASFYVLVITTIVIAIGSYLR